MNEQNYILKTTFITIGSIILISIMLFCIMIFCVPLKSAELFYDMGLKSYSSTLYYKHYKNTDKIEYLNKALSIQIETGSIKDVIKYSEEFFEHKDYSEFIKSLNEKNLNSNFNLYMKSKLINENNYYKNSYIKALILNEEIEKAKTFANSELENNNPMLKELGCYLFSNFISKVDYNYFETEVNNVKIYEYINSYFNGLTTIFNASKDNFADSEKVYMYAITSKILQVGNDLKNITENITTNIDVSVIETSLEEATNFMQSLMED